MNEDNLVEIKWVLRDIKALMNETSYPISHMWCSDQNERFSDLSPCSVRDSMPL